MYSAILLRVNPEVWPVWEQKIQSGADIWFKANRLRTNEVEPGVPVVVLGTKGLGVIATGKTSSGVELRSDPDYSEVAPELQEDYRSVQKRFSVRLEPACIELETLKKLADTAELYRRRETSTPLSVQEHAALQDLIERHRRASK